MIQPQTAITPSMATSRSQLGAVTAGSRNTYATAHMDTAVANARGTMELRSKAVGFIANLRPANNRANTARPSSVILGGAERRSRKVDSNYTPGPAAALRKDDKVADQLSASADAHGLPLLASARSLAANYLELAKARLGALVVLTALVGYVLGAGDELSLSVGLAAVVGTALSAFGANILNQWWEVERDRRMLRTRSRPLPAGRVDRRLALVSGLVTALAGLLVLAAGTNLLTTLLSLFVILLYVLVYTPLKVRTPLNTVVGAVCGAVPPMMGWAAATGRLDLGAWILGGILFVWQVPHFLALAWLYREDYARGGFRMMPAADPEGVITGRAAFLYALALLPITGALALAGVTGVTYLVLSQVVGLGFVVLGWAFARQRVRVTARRLFLASIIYLPVLLGLMVGDMDDRMARLAGFEPSPRTEVAMVVSGLEP
jgi:protoheme IX farnesyltransferase